ncbi:hypothetical protein IWX49DRAFT_624909 [Phyllosticta citricarpa]|uniref:Uncharacterized protein n=1 Tax=Phyllosticta paracitricarpa TaxID=2016321 RepID=A0ABR1N9T2_9PEZI
MRLHSFWTVDKAISGRVTVQAGEGGMGQGQGVESMSWIPGCLQKQPEPGYRYRHSTGPGTGTGTGTGTGQDRTGQGQFVDEETGVAGCSIKRPAASNSANGRRGWLAFPLPFHLPQPTTPTTPSPTHQPRLHLVPSARFLCLDLAPSLRSLPRRRTCLIGLNLKETCLTMHLQQPHQPQDPTSHRCKISRLYPVAGGPISKPWRRPAPSAIEKKWTTLTRP